LDSRTYIPIPVFNRNTYTILGSGCKGIVYYQWRGDCPVPGVPYPNSCGLLNYDGTKTHNYENAANTLKFIQQMNDLLVKAERCHEGVGMLHSDYAAFLCDAGENDGHDTKHNSYLMEYTEIYRKLRDAGYNVSITDAAHLDANPFGIKVLYVPHVNMLSPDEAAAVDRFMERGGKVYENTFTGHQTMCIGFKLHEKRVKTYEERAYDLSLSVRDIADLTGVHPMAQSLNADACIQMLQGDGCRLMVITNISVTKPQIDASVKLAFPVKRVRAYAMDGEKETAVTGDLVTISGITDGCILWMEI
jgi:hypothetical protein